MAEVKRRLGTLYRNEMLRALGLCANSGRVLDVGCHDAFFLGTLTAPMRVGVDLAPQPGQPGVSLVCADARHLPFDTGAFDWIYALDVIEHVKDDGAFAAELARCVAPGGQLLLSTPSRFIRLNPPFLTRWISRQWGHHDRLGYTPEELTRLFGPWLQVKVEPWNALAFRLGYLAVRGLAVVWPALSARLMRSMARWDARRREGQSGFYFLTGRREGSQGHVETK